MQKESYLNLTFPTAADPLKNTTTINPILREFPVKSATMKDCPRD